MSPAPAQSTIAFARSSFVGRSARCTAPQAAWAFRPFIVRPPSICTTAAPRPIVAIVPLSWYLNGFGSLPSRRRAIVSPDVLAGLQRDRAELRQDLLGLRVRDRGDVADGVDLRMTRDREIRSDADPVAALELEPERLDERVALEARAPDERVRRDLRAGLQRHAGGRDRGDALAGDDLDGALLERLLA